MPDSPDGCRRFSRKGERHESAALPNGARGYTKAHEGARGRIRATGSSTEANARYRFDESELLVVVETDVLRMCDAVSRNHEINVIDAFPTRVEHISVRDRIAVPRRGELYPCRRRV